MGRRIVLFPFKKSSFEFTFAKKNWQTAQENKINKLRDRETGKPPDDVKFLQYEFFSLGAQVDKLKLAIGALSGGDDQLYICGHCSAGSEFIAADSEGRTKIGFLELAFILKKELELKEAFAGKIKIYACFSAVAKGNDESFALRFKKIMSRAKYKNCQVIGYAMSVGEYYDEHKIAFAGTDEEFKKIASMMYQYEDGNITKEELDKFAKPQLLRAKDHQIPV